MQYLLKEKSMKKIVVSLILLLIVMVACSKEKETTDQTDKVPEMIEVNIQTPETININEEVTIQTIVTQGIDKVDDANEVKFEFWKVGQEEHKTVVAQNDGDGVYSMSHSFTENGQYVVISHVTARSMHSMPRKEFIVGSLEEAKGTQEITEETQDTAHEEGHDDHHGHHESSLTIELNQENVFSVNKEVTLSSTLTNENAPLLGAKVRFEIIPEDESKTEWLDANEEGEGVYSALTTFKNPGMYHIQIHVNKDELHEHKVIMVTVK
jgi:hypothetical protein